MSAANHERSGAREPPPTWDEEDVRLLEVMQPHLGEQGLNTQNHPHPTDAPTIRVTIRRY